MKQAGILCPISALPGSQGVGDFGRTAYQFVDYIARANIKLWQILPLNPLSYGNSPYQPYSSYAGDEIYISLNLLVEEGLLKKYEVTTFNRDEDQVHYEEVRAFKEKLYRKAYRSFVPDDDYHRFVDKQDWLAGYAIYRVFKSYNHDKVWTEWTQQFKEYPKRPTFDTVLFQDEINYQYFLQYIFYKQWFALKSYANEKGIMIIGDMPIYVGLDSADVWQNQENFLLESDGSPSFVAGVPPDYFSKYGQRWGNPIYDWDYMEKDGFTFWIKRMASACSLYDILRIDHFRGFDTFWKIPTIEPTAVIGEWVEAPGYALFDAFFKQYPDAHILAEDLGELREEVYELRDHYHFKGMYVYMFHHNDKFDFDKVIVYTGTHDNDTLVSWYDQLTKAQKKKLDTTLEDYKERLAYRKIIHYCLDLPAETVIIPIWDLLGLPGSCRFNTPGTIGEPNWMWRLTNYQEFVKALDFYNRVINESKRA